MVFFITGFPSFRHHRLVLGIHNSVLLIRRHSGGRSMNRNLLKGDIRGSKGGRVDHGGGSSDWSGRLAADLSKSENVHSLVDRPDIAKVSEDSPVLDGEQGIDLLSQPPDLEVDTDHQEETEEPGDNETNAVVVVMPSLGESEENSSDHTVSLDVDGLSKLLLVLVHLLLKESVELLSSELSLVGGDISLDEMSSLNRKFILLINSLDHHFNESSLTMTESEEGSSDPIKSLVVGGNFGVESKILHHLKSLFTL